MSFWCDKKGTVAFLLALAVMLWAAVGFAASGDCPKFLAGHKVGTVQSGADRGGIWGLRRAERIRGYCGYITIMGRRAFTR